MAGPGSDASKKIADGEASTMPATIEDARVLDEIGGALKGKGVGA
jgi:propionyl-CoA synthetase